MWLGPRDPSFLHGGRLIGILVERSLLVNEPTITCPQDQVQKPKNLQKEKETGEMFGDISCVFSKVFTLFTL